MTDLFLARVRVGLADRLKALEPLLCPAEELQATRMALDAVDVDASTLNHLTSGVNQRSPGDLLAAFWRHYKGELGQLFRLYNSPRRLLVNPPPGLAVKDETVTTLVSQPWLAGHYGSRLDELPAFYTFDDVVIFWGAGVRPEDITNHILPGTTLTLLTPSKVHSFWLAWCQFESGLGPLMSALEAQFNVVPVHSHLGPNVTVEVLGIESMQLEPIDEEPRPAHHPEGRP